MMSSTSASYIYGVGNSLYLRNHDSIVNFGRHSTVGVKPGICVAGKILLLTGTVALSSVCATRAKNKSD